VDVLCEAVKSQAAVVRGHDLFPVLPKPRENSWVDLRSLVTAVHLKCTALCVKVMDNRVQVSSIQMVLLHHHRKFLFSPLFNYVGISLAYNPRFPKHHKCLKMTRNLVNESVLTPLLARLCQFFEKVLQKSLTTAGIKVLSMSKENKSNGQV
jgi:hypothetical protein